MVLNRHVMPAAEQPEKPATPQPEVAMADELNSELDPEEADGTEPIDQDFLKNKIAKLMEFITTMNRAKSGMLMKDPFIEKHLRDLLELASRYKFAKSQRKRDDTEALFGMIESDMKERMIIKFDIDYPN